jgi:hypothetical protein
MRPFQIIKEEKMDTDLDIKPEVMESMRLPWMKKPFYKTEAKDTTPTWRPKRSISPLNKMRRSFYDLVDDYGNLLLCFMFALVGTAVILVWATWPR